jgi:hypothetical protein
MRFAALQREQAAETTNVGRGDLQFWMAAPNLVFEHADREIVAAGTENCVLYIGDPVGAVPPQPHRRR